jgi:hypothetical protein
MSSRAHKTWKEGREGRKLNEQIAGGAASGQGRGAQCQWPLSGVQNFFHFLKIEFFEIYF